VCPTPGSPLPQVQACTGRMGPFPQWDASATPGEADKRHTIWPIRGLQSASKYIASYS